MNKEIEKLEEVEEVAKAVKGERQERQEVLIEAQDFWNGFIKGLLAAVVGWKAYSEFCVANRLEIDEFPLNSQKIFVRFNPKGDLGFMIEDIFATPNVKEHLKELLIKNEVKED